MEFEQLEMGKRCLMTAIARQDVGDYYDILHPNVILVSHFKYPPSPPVVADTIPLLARRTRRAASKSPSRNNNNNTIIKEKNTITRPTTTATNITTTNTATTTVAATRGVNSEGIKTDGNRSKITQQQQQQQKHKNNEGNNNNNNNTSSSATNAIYEADIVEGPLLTTERLYTILHWMNKGQYIAETTVEMEARKVILQESEILPPPPAPKSEAERYAQIGRQYTDRNQRLSRLIVTFGRELLLFRDECYFEDGFIVTIHRFMLSTQEMLTLVGLGGYQQQPQTQRRIEKLQAEKLNFYAARKSRIDVKDHATLPMLDFTFCNISDPLQLLKVRPAGGKVHTVREIQPNLDPQLAQGVFLNQQSDPARPQKEQRVIVKARNKQGDEEVYEFVESAKSRYGFLHDPKGHAESSIEALAGKMENIFETTSVRISGCGMESTEKLVPVLRRLVVNAIMTIRALDLSNNQISILPDFSLLPLQRLQLHQNKISDWTQVESRVCPLPLLHAVTLHGNPIAENDQQYWQSALSKLLRHPNRVVRLRQLDFVTLTRQDYNMAGAFELFTTGNAKLLEASRGKNPGTNGLVV